MPALLSEKQDRIIQAIGAKRWNQVEEAFEEISGEAQSVAFHQPIVDKLVRKQDHKYFQTLYEAHLDSLLAAGLGQQALELADYLLSQDRTAEWLRPRIVKAAQTAYASGGERTTEILAQSGINDPNVGLSKAYLRMKDLIGSTRGQVYIHQSWGIGIVRDLDIRTGKVIIDFDLKKNQPMTLDGVRNFLIPIPREHIRARVALDKDELRIQLKEAPAEVLKTALRSFNGRIKVSELKKHLTDRFLNENEYKSFWNEARKAIKLDPWIDQTGTGTHAELILRPQPRSFFDQVLQELIKASTAGQRFEALRDVRRHGSDADMTEQDAETLYQLYVKTATDGSLATDVERLSHGLLFYEFADLFEGRSNPLNVDTILLTADPVELIRDLEIHELRRIAMERIMKLHPEKWGEIFSEVALVLDTRTAGWMEREMKAKDEHHFRQVAFENIVAKPDDNPDLFIWAARNILEQRWQDLAQTLPPIMIFEELLSLLSELQDQFEAGVEPLASQAKNGVSKIRSLLNEGQCKQFKRAANAGTSEEARRILQTIRLHNALSHQLKSQLEGILVDAHEDLRKSSRMEDEEEKRRPAYHYTTRGSVDQKRMELSRLLNEEIPAMSKVIEAARLLGDLRENAEYHAAKDRQKLYMQQAAELEDLLARARVVEPRDITRGNESTRFGTKVTLRATDTNETRHVTLLGMWEADPSRHIISYLTPFGSQLLGRKINEIFVVNAQDGTRNEFEVVAIEAAVAPPEIGS